MELYIYIQAGRLSFYYWCISSIDCNWLMATSALDHFDYRLFNLFLTRLHIFLWLAVGDRARKHGMEKFVSVEPWRKSHAELFRLLQSSCLEFRMQDQFVSLGWFSPSQMFVLDEYCARYGVRGCHRHLCYLADLLDRAEKGIMIDPALVHYSYAFCSRYIFGTACVSFPFYTPLICSQSC